MFGPNSANGGSSLFGGGVNTSTPTSKVASSENTFQPRQKSSSGGLFGSVSGVANGVSTPSPSGGLFGSSQTNNAQPSANTFGAKNPTNSTSGGLFANNSAGNNLGQPSGGLFGSTSASKNPVGGVGGLFSQTNDNGNSLNSGGNTLFGSSAKNASNTGGLFGSTTANGTASSGLFSNKPSSGGGFGIGNAGTTASAGSLFSSSSSQQSQNASSLSANPYGLQLNSLTGSSMAPMPESITSNIYKKDLPSEKKNGAEKPQGSNISSPNNSLSFSNLKSSTTLIGKLSSTLKSARRAQPTQGLFSPARKSILRQELSHRSGDDIKSTESQPFLNSTDAGSQNTAKGSNLRKLKIDTNRSASKKLKLLNGSSKPTSMKVLAERKPILGKEAHEAETGDIQLEKATTEINVENDSMKGSHSLGGSYWCSPSIDQLVQLPIKQLCSVPDFVIGRHGFGSISFENDVDLSSLVDDLEHNLFGEIVRFHNNKTVEVYPDSASKPSFGYGLNVPATITLEKVYALGQGTKVPITDYNAKEVQLLIKRLKMQKGMAFISYNPSGGLWTFKVQHFSIWGLVDEAEKSDSYDRSTDMNDRKVAYPRNRAIPRVLSKNSDPHNIEIRSIAAGASYGASKNILSALDSQDVPMLNILDEKQYEPSDVNEDDFFHLEAHTKLSVSDDWEVQLKLAGANTGSVFASTKVPRNNLLFPSLEADLKMRKDIKRKLRILGPVPFVRFSANSKILFSSPKSTDGLKLVPVISRDENLHQKTRQTLMACMSRASIDTRKQNGYPFVSQWSVTVEEIGHLISAGNDATPWTLLSVLFDEEESVSKNVDKESREQTRYKKLCGWAAQQILSNHKLSATEDANTSLFHSLVVGDVIGAAKLAIKTRNAHLAALISLLTVPNGNVKFLAREQLRLWNSLNRTVEPYIIKIYHLLAGDLLEAEGLVTMSREHTWLECFSIYLLYGDFKTLSLKEIVTKFVRKPFSGNRSKSEEVIFRILKFYGTEERNEKILESAQISQDTREAWFIMQILRFKQICQLSDKKMDRITQSFVEELVAKGFLSEALFCLLFTHNNDVAKREIDVLISRNVQFFSQQSSQKLLESLQIPRPVLFNGLALFAKYNGDFFAEAENLLEGGLIETAAKCISLKVGPELVLQGCQNKKRLEKLKDLSQKVLRQRTTTLQNYLNLFLNYTQFILEDNIELKQIEKIIQTLPAYYTDCGHSEMVSICCSLMSSDIALAYLDRYAGTTSVADISEKLLTLPMGEPELHFIKRKIESKTN
ncbi:LAFA_0C02718g1_1 [Lachancea sp. 'fantastica']|nr:LAFA_0C02718g1_1 [Lachancea sp. 'fantastica']